MEWYHSDDIIIPKHLIPKQSKNDSEEEFSIKMKLAKEKMKYESEIMKIRSKKYERKFKAVDSKIEDKILVATLESHHKRKCLLDAWNEEYEEQEKRSLNIWKLKEEFIIKKSYIHNEGFKKAGTISHARGDTKISNQREAKKYQIKKPRKIRNNSPGRKAQKKNSFTPESSVQNNKYSPYNSRHEIEREYLHEMDEMVMCEEENITFDKTKLEKLTELLERLSDEEFKSTTVEKETKGDNTDDICLNMELDSDHTPVTKNNDSCYLKNKTCKSKLPPASKIPIPIAKKKGIQRKIEFEIT